MRYIAFIIQEGEGCDYTIGCARNLVVIPGAKNMEEAKEKMIQIIKEEYYDDTSLQSCQIFEVSDEHSFNVGKIYQDMKNEKKNKKQRELEEKEKMEYERLVKKFGDSKK